MSGVEGPGAEVQGPSSSLKSTAALNKSIGRERPRTRTRTRTMEDVWSAALDSRR